MRIATVALVAALMTSAALCSSVADGEVMLSRFAEFKQKYGKAYTAAEESQRFKNFVENMKKAEKMQQLNPRATFGVNAFSDLSEAEFKTKHNGEAHFRSAIRARQARNVEAPKSKDQTPQQVDWRAKGVVTPIKNQQSCGGCWAFSTTGNIEGQWALAGHPLVSLSEQELISCDTTCNGCNGGIMDDAFEWLVNTQGGGITSEAQYPFVSGDGVAPACDLTGKTSVAYINGHTDIAHSESAMASYVAAHGPVSIAVDATSFQTYTGGVMTNCVANQVDHGVLIVGYDLTASTPYWIVKNQWGTTWGIDGYIYLAYGSNECLITTLPSSSTVGANPPPPGPNPPSPPTPPTPAGGNFTQYTCPDFTCADGCTGTSLPTDTCLSLSSGSGTAIATCGTSNLHLQIFTSSDCTGSSTTQTIPLNQCNQDNSGNYIYDTCGSAKEAVLSKAAKVRVPKRL